MKTLIQALKSAVMATLYAFLLIVIVTPVAKLAWVLVQWLWNNTM